MGFFYVMFICNKIFDSNVDLFLGFGYNDRFSFNNLLITSVTQCFWIVGTKYFLRNVITILNEVIVNKIAFQ